MAKRCPIAMAGDGCAPFRCDIKPLLETVTGVALELLSMSASPGMSSVVRCRIQEHQLRARTLPVVDLTG
jgi:hypothetical protein